ncbi:MAG: hypothetical protein Fur0023_17100 [Bacteroidia bacterium]
MITFSACTTYYLTPESLVQQLAQTVPENKTTVIVAFPIILPFTVKGNSLKEIIVKDKNWNEVILPVTNRTSIRITEKNGKRTTFYFNTLIIKDSMITGKKDHFIGINIKPININNIQTIELQR